MSDKLMERLNVERDFEFSRWAKEMPYINFPPSWEVKVIPPFGGAVARFKVRNNKSVVSVYMDAYSMLGAAYEPYWEIYPAKDGDVERFVLNDIDGLLLGIKQSFESENWND